MNQLIKYVNHILLCMFATLRVFVLVQPLVENMIKKNRIFFHCGYFNLLDLQSLNNCIFIFYNCNFEIMGACNTLLERYFQELSSNILKPSKYLILQS